jgi:hypothetical protein
MFRALKAIVRLNIQEYKAYINEMQGPRSKIPSKKSRQAALRGGI